MSKLVDEMVGLVVSESKDDWNDLDEETRILDDWLILACVTGTLVDDDIDMANGMDGAEVLDEITTTIRDTSSMDIDEYEWMNSEDMDISEHRDYEDWLESELVEMNIDGGVRDLIFCEENITRMLNNNNNVNIVKIVNNAEQELISREAYENGGSWVVDRWVCPVNRAGRGENNVCVVCPGRDNDSNVDSKKTQMGTKRKRTRPT